MRSLNVAVLIVVAVLGGCGSAQRSGKGSNIDVPASAEEYSTDARSGGVRGGGVSSEVEALLEQYLRARGDEAEPDGALGDTAAWLLSRASRNEDMTSPHLGPDAALRFGFTGHVLGSMTQTLESSEQLFESWVFHVPKNVAINRYGIAGQGKYYAIVLGSVEVTLDDFPRAIAPGATLRLKGKASERYQHISIHATNPAGRVNELPMATRAIDVSVVFRDAGVNKLEIMGHGAVGPQILLNVPIYVGVAPAEDATIEARADPNMTVEAAESIMLTLLNEERAKYRLGNVQADAELRAVALVHSVDMATNQFAAHVSPTTGTPEQRVNKARIRVSDIGECISINVTPEGAHRSLLDSPAHRAGMLGASYTHVGIGVVFLDGVQADRRLIVTLVFGRRPPTDDTLLTAAALVDLIQAQRSALKLPALRVDPTLATAASAAGAALQSASVRTVEEVQDVARRELAAAANRTGVRQTTCQTYYEIIDRHQLSNVAMLMRPDVKTLGVGTARVQSDVGPRLAVIVITDAGAGTCQ
jgi:uncharacterized protein YkwD